MLFWLRHILLYLLVGLIVLAIAAVGVIWFIFGEGEPYRDMSTDPLLPEGTLEVALQSDRPLGNAAISQDGRIFYTIHPESNPEGPTLYEWVDGAPVPFPAEDEQAALFDTPLGLTIDAQNTLWVIDPARHGLGQPRLLRFDLETGEVLYQFDIPREAAPRGSYLQDLAVSRTGDWVYIADVGFWNRRPAIVVVETEVKRAHRMLERHETVAAKNYLVRNQIRPMSYFGGLFSMKTGVDGIALDEAGEWLYFAAMNHDSLYRVPPQMLHNPNLDFLTVTVEIETIAVKPLSDGIAVDAQDNVYITDIEHQAIMRYSPVEGFDTLIKDSRIRWAEGLAFGPDGALYLADSALPEVVLKDAAHHAQAAPYILWKFTPPRTAEPETVPGVGTRSDESGSDG